MTAAAPSEDKATVASGQRLAERHCGTCHAITGAKPGPLPEAPPFAGLFRDVTQQRIDELLAQGMLAPTARPEEGGVRRHPRMPLIELGLDQLADLKAYLRSLRRAAPLGRSA